MPKIGSMFPSKYLKADHLAGRHVNVVIERVTVEEVGDDRKPIVHFRGKDKSLVCNVTNGNMIAEVVGSDDTDDWKGHTIALYPSKTDFGGKRVDCIRVDYPQNVQDAPRKPGQPPRTTQKPTPEPEADFSTDEPPADFQASDDDVPF